MPAVEPVFVDTSYLVALIDPRDSLRERARQMAADFSRNLIPAVTTDAILIELGNYFCRGNLRASAANWMSAIRTDSRWDVFALDAALIYAAEARYRRHSDKNWSMTDCISMEVMRQRRIREVATSDRGFEQAGFRVLMA